MCFDTDMADWYATINDITDGPSDKQSRCDECFIRIAPGEWRRHIYQQEHEECLVCEQEDGDPCPDGNHDYGETYHHDICKRCHELLVAVEAVEADEDCPPYARQPMYGELWDSMHDIDDSRKYAVRAVEMFPELAGWDRLGRFLNQDEE